MSIRLPLRLLPLTSHTFFSRPYTTATVTAPARSTPFNNVPTLTATSAFLNVDLTYSLMELYPSVKIETPSAHLTPTTADEEYFAQMREELDALPIVQALRSNPQLNETMAYAHQNRSTYEQSLTATTLRGRGKVALSPLMFKNEDSSECIVVMHLGKNLCGHEGIIHGGMLATTLDEMTASVTIPSLPNKMGFTANLNVNYRVPTRSEQWVVVRGKLTRVEGRKAYSEAHIESADGKTKFVEATALFISPKYDKPKTDL